MAAAPPEGRDSPLPFWSAASLRDRSIRGAGSKAAPRDDFAQLLAIALRFVAPAPDISRMSASFDAAVVQTHRLQCTTCHRGWPARETSPNESRATP
jgi:hypothetical protein